MGTGSATSWSAGADGLVGRDRVLGELRERLLEGRRTALLVGLPGAGKTSVLEQAGRSAAGEGWRVVANSGHAPDRELPLVSLIDLLTRLGVERAADVLTGHDALRLRLQVLELLEEQTAQAPPLLLLLDDLQWFDRSSVSVLGFVANRLAGSRISLLAGSRLEEIPPDFVEHPRLELPPLTERECVRVLRRAGLDLDAVSRPVVIERAAGNPLALLELGRAAIDGGVETVPSSVETAYAAEVRRLPAPTRWVLMLAAAGDGDLMALGRVLAAEELVAALAPAEQSGLVSVADRVVRFRHPLARAATYSAATTQDRVRAHQALAAAHHDDPDRAVWHRAEATLVPDEEVAAELVEASRRAAARGANFEAARLLTRAADLSPSRRDQDARLLEAAGRSVPMGHIEWLARIATRLREQSDDPEIRARASHFEAYALAQTARQGQARLALVEALGQLLPVDPDTGWASLTTLATLTYGSGTDAELLAAWYDRYARRSDAGSDAGSDAAGSAGAASEVADVIEAAEAWVLTVMDPYARPPKILDLVRHARVPDADRPASVVTAREMILGGTAWLLDEPSVALERLDHALDLMRRTNSPAQMVQTLVARTQVQIDIGAYDDAETSARFLLDLAEAENLSYVGDNAREMLARVAGIRGDAETVRRLREEVLLDIEVGECLALESNLRVAMAYVHFTENDPEGAFQELRGLFCADGSAVHVHIGYRELAHYVVAGVRADAADEARTVLDLAQARLAHAGPRQALQLARARAALRPDDAEPAFEAAVTDPRASSWPFEHANARLEFGIWLRRRHRPMAARIHLQAAFDTFQRLGASAWRDLASSELRAAGVTTHALPTTGWLDLTAQERQVVRMAASGMTNREIATSLYLSPRTVSAHLYNAFPKLGVTARTQLRDVIEATGPL